MSTPFLQFKLPPKVAQGQTIKADDYNKLRAVVEKVVGSMRYLALQPSPDLGIRRGPNGTTAWSKNKRSGSGSSRLPELYASISTTEAGSTITVEPGNLIYQNAGASESEMGVSGYITPSMGGVMLDAAEPPAPLALPGLASWVYLRVKTTADGVPKFEANMVTIEAFSEPQTSVHHVRPNPSSDELEGDYFLLILQTESDGAAENPKPRAKKRIVGNRMLPNQLVEIANVGGQRELYKGYLVGPDDKHELRTIEQIEADGEPVIKPLGETEEEEDTIKWKTVKAGELDQIHVRSSEGGNSIVVEGNAKNGSYEDLWGGRVDYYDGLITGSNPPDITETYTGTISIIDGCGTIQHNLQFDRGLLVAYSTISV